MRSEKLYLADIIEAADAIAEFTAGMDEIDFLQDHKSQSAVLQKLIVIGEAAGRLSKEFCDQHPEVEWRKVVAFRNILVHAYFSIKLDIVWETVTSDVPKLRNKVIELLK